MSVTFEVGVISARVGGEIDYTKQNVLNFEKLGDTNEMSSCQNCPRPLLVKKAL